MARNVTNIDLALREAHRSNFYRLNHIVTRHLLWCFYHEILPCCDSPESCGKEDDFSVLRSFCLKLENQLFLTRVKILLAE